MAAETPGARDFRARHKAQQSAPAAPANQLIASAGPKAKQKRFNPTLIELQSVIQGPDKYYAERPAVDPVAPVRGYTGGSVYQGQTAEGDEAKKAAAREKPKDPGPVARGPVNVFNQQSAESDVDADGILGGDGLPTMKEGD